MKRQLQNDFDQNTLEAMMERYRAELLRYQRATPPGKPTLEDNLRQTALPVDGAASEPPSPPENGPAMTPSEAAADNGSDDIRNRPAVFAGEDGPPASDDEGPMPLPTPEPESAPALSAQEDTAWQQPAIEVMQRAETSAPPPPLPEPSVTVSPKPAPVPLPEPAAPPVGAPCLCHTEFEKCIGGYGSFRPYQRLDGYTCASFLQLPGESTEVLVRFAADIPKGAAETLRCRRSFSVKFFCPDGEYDMTSGHLPVAVGSDEETLSACCSAMRPDPVSGLRSREAFWRFLSRHHEALNAALWLYSDLGTIGSYRMMDGFSLPCYWINSDGGKSLVRTRWLSRQRPQTLSRFEAEELAGFDPDAVSRDLVEALKSGERVQYELAAQIISPERPSAELGFDPFDPTVVWPEDRFALQRLGLLTIDRLPRHFERELACAKFDGGNLIAGIEQAPLAASRGLEGASAHIRSMGELSRRTLISNVVDELKTLPAELLEEILILFTQADLELGRAMTAAMGGI